MTTLLRSDVVLAQESLCVERTGIHIADVDGDRVEITVDVANRGGRRSQPAEMRLSAAPLGAFVAWQPLSKLVVPPIAPGGIARVGLIARRTRVESMPLEGATLERLLEAQRVATRGLAALNLTVRTPQLPLDLLALTQRGSTHWSGNVDVFVGRARVERHAAQGLRVQPGCKNCTHFTVGSRRDAYQFEIEAPEAWAAELRGMSADGEPVRPGAWLETNGMSYVLMTLWPPADCSPAAVNVRVRERSSGNEALVEYDFASIAAAKC